MKYLVLAIVLLVTVGCKNDVVLLSDKVEKSYKISKVEALVDELLETNDQLILKDPSNRSAYHKCYGNKKCLRKIIVNWYHDPGFYKTLRGTWTNDLQDLTSKELTNRIDKLYKEIAYLRKKLNNK